MNTTDVFVHTLFFLQYTSLLVHICTYDVIIRIRLSPAFWGF